MSRPNRDQALAQAIDRSFRFLVLLVGILAIGWLFSGMTTIGPSEKAVVLRFGALRTVQNTPGLLWAWPSPIEEVLRVPASLQSLTISSLDFNKRDKGGLISDTLDPRDDGGYVLSGDGGVLHIEGTVTYRVSNPQPYALLVETGRDSQGRNKVEQGLRRCFCRAVVAMAAQRDLLTLRRDLSELSRELTQTMNQDLERNSWGIEVDSLVLKPFLPQRIEEAFNLVLQAQSGAEQEVSKAQAEATRLAADGAKEADRVVANAKANAAERTTRARTDVAGVLALAAQAQGTQRADVLERAWREQIDQIFRGFRHITVVPKGQSAHLWLGGSSNAAAQKPLPSPARGDYGDMK